MLPGSPLCFPDHRSATNHLDFSPPQNIYTVYSSYLHLQSCATWACEYLRNAWRALIAEARSAREADSDTKVLARERPGAELLL